MKLAASGERFRVIDDFLPEDDLEEIRAVMRRRQFHQVASVVHPEADGQALRSRGAMLRQDAAMLSEDTQVVGMPSAYHAVLQEIHSHQDIFGVPTKDWSVVGFSFWQYAAGSRLGWHNDVDARGEFVFFLHEDWKASWAGDLTLLDADAAAIEVDTTGMSPLEAVEAKASLASHALTAIVPKPNRLVLIKEGTIHCIQRVDWTAGETTRQTMTGFVGANPPEKQQRADNKNLERLASLLDLG
ncbi:2OG-Fe(II) oxygenase [Streptomyces xanthochromogenes]|uniref:2OG-Fe(II) oxygenase n=1 Tax=Streptomyces xanthochromogenes TaxID=67384 RepID=UPI00343A5DC5